MPTALRVRREKGGTPVVEKGSRKAGEEVPGLKQHAPGAATSANPSHVGAASTPQPSMKTKDQMYEAFMREMEGLL